jgi:hypothetical protein
VTGGWRKLHNEELHNLYSSPSKIRNLKSRLEFEEVEEVEVGGTCGTNGREEERVYAIGRKARGKETTRKTET